VDLPALRCFLAVAEEQHFGKAALRLHLTPSPVSRMVKALERELGGDLFVRRHHDVQLTPLGEELLGPVRRIVREADRLPALAEGVLASNRILRVGASHMIAPALTERFVELVERAAAPGRVDVTHAMSSVLIPDVVVGALDLAMVHLPVGEAELDHLGVARYGFHVAMRADDPLASRDSLTLRDLADRTLAVHPVTPQPLAVSGLHQRLAEAGVGIDRVPSPDILHLATHVRRHHGLTLTTDPADGGGAAIFLHSSFAVVPLVDPAAPTIEVGVVWHRARYESDPLLRTIADGMSASGTVGPA